MKGLNNMADNNQIIESVEKVEYIETWKLADFTNELNKRYEEKYKDELNITVNTVNNYFRKLESDGIHFLNRLNGVKIYDKLDMSIAEFIIVKRSKKLQNGLNWQLPQIFDEIGRSFKCRTENDVDLTASSNEKIDMAKLISEIEDKLEKMLIEKYDKKEKQLLLEMSETKKSVNKAMSEMLQIQKKFKNEAIEIWNQKPKSERFVGIIFKNEDFVKRDAFIDEYVTEKMTNYLNELSNQDD